MKKKIKLGISSCLLGENVRYDGGHKLDSYLRDTLGSDVEYIPICPEVECGMPIPREPMRLVAGPDSLRLVIFRTNRDITEKMVSWARKRVVDLEKEGLRGFIFKSRSPSCGMEGVEVYDEKGILYERGIGIFARIFMEHFPLLPVEDEDRLQDPGGREKFLERIFA